jgi:hypothetical protein
MSYPTVIATFKARQFALLLLLSSSVSLVSGETPEAYNERMSKGSLEALVEDAKNGLRLPHSAVELADLNKTASRGGHLACVKWLYPKRPEFWTSPNERRGIRGNAAITNCVDLAREGADASADQVALNVLAGH